MSPYQSGFSMCSHPCKPPRGPSEVELFGLIKGNRWGRDILTQGTSFLHRNNFLFFFKVIRKSKTLFLKHFYWSLVASQCLISIGEQRESAIRIHLSPLFWISVPFKSPQSVGSSSVCRRFSLVACFIGFSGSDGKESVCNVGNLGSVPGLGRSPGAGKCNPLQYSCLENSVDRRAWRAIVHVVTKSWTRLSN